MRNFIQPLLIGGVLCSSVAMLFAASAEAADYPQRKPGLWLISMNSAQMGGQGITTEQCVDAKTDATMQASSMQGPDAKCSEQATQKTANGWTYRVICQIDQSTATTEGTISGNYSSHYEINNVTRFVPAFNGMTEEKMIMTADYKGACPADLNPGDMRMNGMVVNITDINKPRIQINGMPDMKPEQMRNMVEELQKKMQ